MENNQEDLARLVGDRKPALNNVPPSQPNAGRASATSRRRRTVGVFAATMAAGLLLLGVSSPRACADPLDPANEAEQSAQSQDVVRNYKESGSPAAKVTCEIYSDYQCPSCAAAFASSVPQLVGEYVKTGKVKLIHRDYPLPQHQYSKLAARYVNAAGKLGFYDAAVDYIFKTQSVWEKDGSVDVQMAKLLPARTMEKVRLLVQNDRTLDETVASDMAMAVKDKINQTPSMIVVANGKRQLIVPIPNIALLRSYLDDLLK